jgi:hypothetical protein
MLELFALLEEKNNTFKIQKKLNELSIVENESNLMQHYRQLHFEVVLMLKKIENKRLNTGDRTRYFILEFKKMMYKQTGGCQFILFFNLTYRILP